MYYVIEKNYIGFNHDENLDADHIEITTEYEESSVFNDWSTTNHGEFETLKAAREFITDRFGVTRTENAAGESFADTGLYYMYDSVIEVHKVGEYEPLSAEDSIDWVWADIEQDIVANATDSEIDALIEEYVEAASDQGYDLDAAEAKSAAIEYRDELAAEAELE